MTTMSEQQVSEIRAKLDAAREAYTDKLTAMVVEAWTQDAGAGVTAAINLMLNPADGSDVNHRTAYIIGATLVKKLADRHGLNTRVERVFAPGTRDDLFADPTGVLLIYVGGNVDPQDVEYTLRKAGIR